MQPHLHAFGRICQGLAGSKGMQNGSGLRPLRLRSFLFAGIRESCFSVSLMFSKAV